MPKTPEQWLAATVSEKGASIFKLFLGYAPGVGKTFSMLSEAVRRHSRGEDVVIGVVETHGRQAVSELASMLDTVPRKKLEYRGATFAEMDVDAILTRKPKVVLVDELAHTNIEGSKHSKRYEDVLELLDAGIDVLSTMNIQHLESISPTVQGSNRHSSSRNGADWVLQRVNEVVMVDLTPEALQNRMRRGDIYPLERVGRALENFFKQGNLIALRELALRQVANAVDRNLESHRQLEQPDQAVAVRERIAVCISSNPAAQYLIARAARMAQAIGGELYVVYVDMGQDSDERDPAHTRRRIFVSAENVGAVVVRLQGNNVAEPVAQLVREKHITQVVFWPFRRLVAGSDTVYFSAIHKFLRDAPPVDVHIVTQNAD